MIDLPTTSLPGSWVWSRIQDVATTSTGGTPSRTVKEYFGGTIPWVKSGELGDGHVFETEETLSELGLNSSSAKLFPKGTLCIALYGATVGKLGILKVDAATNQAVCGIFLPDAIHRDFVFHYLASIRHHLIEQGKGGAQSNISNGLVRQTWIPLAPTNEQRRIVAKIEELFSDLDAGVAALERAKANLKRYRAAVLKAAVEGKLTEAWRAEHPDTEPASKLLERILAERRQKWEADQLAKFATAKKEPPKNWKEKYVEPTPPDTTGLPELPENWCWASVEQISDPHRPVSYGILKPGDYVESGVPMLRIVDLKDGKAIFDDVHRVSHELSEEFARTRLQGGEVLVSLVGTIGRIGHVPHSIPPANIHRNLGMIAPMDLVSGRFLATALTSDTCQKQIRRFSTGALQPLFNLADLKRLAIPVPPFAEQEQIGVEVGEKLSQIDAADTGISHSVVRATRLRQSILKEAFEGKLVPQDPSDEPASVLLERLREKQAIHEGNGRSLPKTRGGRRSHSKAKVDADGANQ